MTAVPKQQQVSFEELHRIARVTMQAQFDALKSKGHAQEEDAEAFYGFQPEDVIEMHNHKHGVGRGLWYRLKDDRVIDGLGKPAERERYWYVAHVH